jgi:hypothetical protein
LAGYLLYFLGMSGALDALVPGVARRRPWPLVLALTLIPLALLVDSSPAARTVSVMALAGLAWRAARRPNAAREEPALSGAIARGPARP